MFNFEDRTGPRREDPPVYPTREVPEWYRDAKLGFFVHWGLYSVPAWATTDVPSPLAAEDEYTYHRYAEWYGNTVRIMRSPTRTRHEELYGVGTSYEDLADRWDASAFDASAFVRALVGAGGRYLVPTTKHHDGFCLWDTATTGFNAVRRGPRRDLIGEFRDAARSVGARFGVYFSGALDWHVSDFPPIESDEQLFAYRRNDERFARYAARQLEELIERFEPELIWNDIEWPDAGKGREAYGVAALLERYFARVQDGVVNDRWGVPYHGFLTREYSEVPDIIASPWEATRGLGLSFGYNQDESGDQSLSGAQLIRLLVDVVSKNGNLLLNVGPRADGSIPELQAAALGELGAWLAINGEAVYGTRAWIRFGEEEHGTRVTTHGGATYLHVLDPARAEVVVPGELAGRPVTWIGAGPGARTADARLAIPAELRGSAVAVARVGR